MTLPIPPRTIWPAAALASLFVGTVAVMLHVIPGPHTETHYLVVGCVATLILLAALLLGFVRIRRK